MFWNRKMRRKRKVWYTVSDDNSPSLWWQGSKLTRDLDGKGGSSHKTCYTMLSAVRAANKIDILGGKGMITQFVIRKGKRYCRDMWLN